MTLSIKQGVVIDKLHPAMVTALPTIMQVLRRHGLDATITEGNDTIDRQHYSLHKVIPLCALDFRTWEPNIPGKQIDDAQKAAICIDLRVELGEDYDVTWGAFNIHVEFDPK